MLNEELKHIFQRCKCERWWAKANGPLRQAQGPVYGGSRPSFPRRRESIETSCKMDPRIREDDKGPEALRKAQGPGFLPTVSEPVELAVMNWQGLEKKKITTIKHERTRSDSFFFRAFPCNSVANAFLCSSSVSVVNCLTLVELLDTALAHPFQHIEITLGI
jgi:hypothetical protein